MATFKLNKITLYTAFTLSMFTKYSWPICIENEEHKPLPPTWKRKKNLSGMSNNESYDTRYPVISETWKYLQTNYLAHCKIMLCQKHLHKINIWRTTAVWNTCWCDCKLFMCWSISVTLPHRKQKQVWQARIVVVPTPESNTGIVDDGNNFVYDLQPLETVYRSRLAILWLCPL